MDSTYDVIGMTCGHCAQAVSREVRGLAGVSTVEVDVAAGTVAVASDGPLDPAAVASAVAEAGYRLAG